ncbi:MAG: RagB/SusD family nutrient uptake outer membrane protein [Bacteroidetes bacterium]|nr:RagB/SusD family nutrient uptake outer membrane protein [Bacteroidota bacterium]
MKKRRNYIILGILSLAAAAVIAGCIKHPLDQVQSGQYNTGNYWRNQNDVLAGINGIYNILYTEDYIGHHIYVYDDQSDDISVAGDHSDFWAVERFNADATLQLIGVTWPFAYEQIGRANNALIYIPKVPVMDDPIRQRSMGEAYFLRGYAYFILSEIYGDVPIITEKNVTAVDYNVAKSSIDSVRKQAENDFLQAANLLPETYGDADRGRVSKGAAWGMLCKLYMIEDRLADAVTYGTKVISDPNYALATNYADNFTVGNQESNSEILFAVWNNSQLTANVPTSAISQYFTNRSWQGWGFHQPTQNFADEFETADTIRKRATLVSVGDTIPYQKNIVDIGAPDAYQMFAGKEGQSTGRMLPSMSATGYCVRKYTAFVSDGNPAHNGQIDFNLKQPLLRTADIYLLVAEAKIRQNGPGGGDAELNKVRTRAGLLPRSGATMAQLIHERRVELGAENTRWQDLLRWDKDKLINLDTIVSKPKAASPLPPYNGSVIIPARTFVRPKDYYMPLPQQIIDESKGVIKQNPNY